MAPHRSKNGRNGGPVKLKLAAISRLSSLPLCVFEDAIEALMAQTIHMHHMAAVDKANRTYWRECGNQLAESAEQLKHALTGR